MAQFNNTHSNFGNLVGLGGRQTMAIGPHNVAQDNGKINLFSQN